MSESSTVIESPGVILVEDPLLPAKQRSIMPGDLAMWIFIIAELSVFALLFLLFSYLRSSHPNVFLAGQQTLHPLAGLINTLALLSSSALAAQAVYAVRHRLSAGTGWLLLSIPVGAIYIVVKLWEYQQLVRAGYDLDTNHFYTGYFLLTGFHLLHVVLGMVILTFMSVRLWRGAYQPESMSGLESGVCYWHMVDLVWVILFPLIYVIH
ncbi:nitric oxide reductase NorE protein [Neptunomonas antarctica]|uniref:Nitric oxide reductase NorE protein n=1 Tax=Neptunomonas antarctica TaxID=619304 RepID=A0A1N7P8U1_9GAMM|nr:nitric oxide reductase NorE protein [Neptunomonas antarctica]